MYVPPVGGNTTKVPWNWLDSAAVTTMRTEYIYGTKRGVTQDIIIRGQSFRLAQIAQEFPGARLIQASAGVRHDLSPQVGDAFPLTPGDD